MIALRILGSQFALPFIKKVALDKVTDLVDLGKTNFHFTGNAIGDVGNVVLRDRKVLSEDGIFIVAITVNRREKRIISKAKVHTRGFIYVKKSRDILRESAEIVNQSVEEYLAQDSFDWGELKGAVRDSLAKYLFDQTKRRPAILPVIMEVR